MSDAPGDGGGLARRPLGSGDEWVTGPDGQRFWGKHGSAGLLAHHAERGVLLQLRASWSHFGGTWGLPGGARHEDETAVMAALREANEEAGVPAGALAIEFSSTVDLGFWSYTTVVAQAREYFEPQIGDAESADLRWVPVDEVELLPLHPGFAASWPGLRDDLAHPVCVIVDSANVVGSRPNMWWKDRVGATTRFAEQLQDVAERGVPAAALSLDRDHRWPEFVLVVEGQAVAVEPRTPGDDAMNVVRLVRASADGDQAIVDEVRQQVGAAATAELPAVFVVTADRELADRVERLGASVLKPKWLWQLIDEERAD